MSRKVIQGKPLFRGAEVAVGSANLEARTVNLVWTTGAKGKRSDWMGDEWNEELAVEPGAIRMDRLNGGAPLLDSHQQRSLSSQIGVVERAWIEGGKGMATVRFSSRDDVGPIFRDVASGIIRNVSVGYRVYKWMDVSQNDDKIPSLRAVDWEPFELSFVPIGFDAGAQARARAADDTYESEIISTRSASSERQGGSVDPQELARIEAEKVAAAAAKTAELDEAADKARGEAVAAERARFAEIAKITATAKLDDTFSRSMIEAGHSVDKVRELAWDAWAKRGNNDKPTSGVRIEAGSHDEVVLRREGVENALLARANAFIGGKQVALTDNGRRYAGRQLREIARRHLELQGVNTDGMGVDQVVQRVFHSTSDFPAILANVANKSLLAGYEQLFQAQTFRPFVKVKTTPDFKQISRVRRGEVPSLDKIPEGASVTSGSIAESKEVYTLAEYGKIFAITRQTIINDDLSAFTELPMLFGGAAARLESDLVYAVITANAAMGDTVALFHATHSNLDTAAAISIATLATARQKMRTQKGLAGKDYLNIIPRFLVVPAALETIAFQFTSPGYMPQQGSNINPFAGTLTVVAEPRLDATSATQWYVFASPADGVDTIELCYLEGANGPQVTTEMGFDVNGVRIKALHDVAAKATDWRGMFRNG